MPVQTSQRQLKTGRSAPDSYLSDDGKIFPSDEPPTDRNVHKIWRAVEKYKVSYVSNNFISAEFMSIFCHFILFLSCYKH